MSIPSSSYYFFLKSKCILTEFFFFPAGPKKKQKYEEIWHHAHVLLLIVRYQIFGILWLNLATALSVPYLVLKEHIYLHNSQIQFSDMVWLPAQFLPVSIANGC